MSPRGYTTLTRLERRSGQSLSGSLALESNALIEAAENWIDQRTGRPWLNDGTPMVERYAPARLIRLNTRPVASVTQVRSRYLGVDAEWTVLDAGDWEVLDAERGEILLSAWWGNRSPFLRSVEVTYVPVAVTSVDARVELACTDLVLYWLRGRLPGDGGITGDIQSYRVGDDLQVVFRQGAMVLGVPDSIVDVIDNLGGKRLAFA